MQLLVLQWRHSTHADPQPGHADPTRSHPRYSAHLTESFAPGARLLSTTVLLALTSLDTVDGLTPTDLAISLHESPFLIPSSIVTLLSLSMCLPFESLIGTPFPAGARAVGMLG